MAVEGTLIFATGKTVIEHARAARKHLELAFQQSQYESAVHNLLSCSAPNEDVAEAHISLSDHDLEEMNYFAILIDDLTHRFDLDAPENYVPGGMTNDEE